MEHIATVGGPDPSPPLVRPKNRLHHQSMRSMRSLRSTILRARALYGRHVGSIKCNVRYYRLLVGW